MFYKIVGDIIEKYRIRTYKNEKVFLAFRNVYERSFMSRKELKLIIGLFSKVNKIFESLDLYEK